MNDTASTTPSTTTPRFSPCDTALDCFESAYLCRLEAEKATCEAEKALWLARVTSWMQSGYTLMDEADGGGGDDTPPPAVALAIPDLEPDAGMIYTRSGPPAEAWVRVSLTHSQDGPRVVIEQGASTYVLRPTRFVLEGITTSLTTFTPDELATGRVRLGPVGVHALRVLARSSRMAA